MTTPTPLSANDEYPFGLDAPLAEVMRTTRAMRRLKPDPVDPALLEQLVQAATWGPSGSNSQSESWVVVVDRDVIGEVAKLWPRVYAVYRHIFARATPATTTSDAQERMYRAADHLAEHFAEVPALLVACYDPSGLRAVFRDPGTWLQIAKTPPMDAARMLPALPRVAAMGEAASVYPGIQNVLLAARALGLGATMTTLHLLLEKEFKALLGIPHHVHTFAIVPIGWPRGRFGPVKRRPVADVIRWNRW